MKTVLITGASSGIGKELAYVYAEKKYNLILTARRKEKLDEIKNFIEKEHKVEIKIIVQDLSKPDSANKLFDIIQKENLNVDILINNAGFGTNGFFVDIEIERTESMLNLNILTLTKLCKLFIPEMKKAGCGHIINIASTGAFQGVPNLASYSATKAYVLHFSEGIAEELKNDNIHVTAICPGPTQSEFAQVAEVKNQKTFTKAPTSRQLAEYIYKMMQKKKITAVHGFKNKFLVFSQRFIPRKLITKVAGKIME